jgi:co-chaperonin GroES (HSP10)
VTCPYKPTEFYVVVELDPPETVTAGGIIILDSVKEREELATEEGVLVAKSPVAFTYADWPEDAEKPEIGNRVMVKRYDGILRKKKVDGVEKSYRIVPDKSIVAVIEGGE